MSLRARLVLLALVAAAPALAATLVLERVVTARLEESAQARLEAAQRAVVAHLERVQARLASQVEASAREDLADPPCALADTEPSDAQITPGHLCDELQLSLAASLGQRRNLPLFELIDTHSRVVSSAHWPVGLGLVDRDRPFAGNTDFRLEHVAEEYGAGDKLALSVSRPATWNGQSVSVRGGVFLDTAFLSELSALMQVDVALFDQRDTRWVTATGSALASWSGPEITTRARGSVALGGANWRWNARALCPELWLVTAVPRRDQDLLQADVRRTTLLTAGVALAVGLSAALVLAGGIARPVAELAEGARRVSAGEFEGRIPSSGPGEIGALARTFDEMTAALRSSRARLLQAERVASWREMARRLAHELKNPLFPIQLSVETLRRALERRGDGRTPAPDEPVFEQLFVESSDTILEAIGSLRRIIDEFSDFARMPLPEPRHTDLNAIVAQVLGLYRARAGSVTIETQLDAALPLAAVDPELLRRALGNLVANALEAMPTSGTLRLRTGTREDGVIVEVADTGPGLDAEQRTRLFTPYYTTKRGGTGLGLAIVQGIVSDHGGRIDVESEPGRGTSFTLLLPRATEA